MSILTYFGVFLSSSKKILRAVTELSDVRFLLNPFQFTFHCSCCHFAVTGREILAVSISKSHIMKVFTQYRPKRASRFRVESSYSIQKVIDHLIIMLN